MATSTPHLPTRGLQMGAVLDVLSRGIAKSSTSEPNLEPQLLATEVPTN
jgi:hypothetical protein